MLGLVIQGKITPGSVLGCSGGSEAAVHTGVVWGSCGTFGVTPGSSPGLAAEPWLQLAGLGLCASLSCPCHAHQAPQVKQQPQT